jgi:hypothetical protein
MPLRNKHLICMGWVFKLRLFICASCGSFSTLVELQVIQPKPMPRRGARTFPRANPPSVGERLLKKLAIKSTRAPSRVGQPYSRFVQPNRNVRNGVSLSQVRHAVIPERRKRAKGEVDELHAISLATV